MDDMPTSSCPCAQYMEWGRHDPANHRPPPVFQPPKQREALNTTRAAALIPSLAPGPIPVQTEPRSAEQTMLDGLRDVLHGEGRKATFTCGGRIPVVMEPNRTATGNLTPRTDEKVQEQRIVTKPVTVRWGSDGQGRVLALPAVDGNDQAALGGLVRACAPATFGRDGKDVLDETYRRAGALSTSEFMTDFCPYEMGIIDIVTQLLLPPVIGDLDPGPERSELAVKHDLTVNQDDQIRYAIDFEIAKAGAIRDWMQVSRLSDLLQNLDVPAVDEAELRQIKDMLDPELTLRVMLDDVYAFAAQRLQAKQQAGERERGVQTLGPKEIGPSGLFRPHVDTPRSDTQIGSLVVCLPVEFDGGALAVRHQGQQVLHDWAAGFSSVEPAIQWAAFYSDCEHEVLEVTAGHRLTLTYNLFLAPGSGHLAGRALTLQSTRLPLYQQLRSALTTADFMPEGGYLGIMLAHNYPHTHPKLHHFVPSMLKGSDMALHEAVYASGLTSVLETTDAARLPTADVLEALNRMRLAAREPSNRDERHEASSNLVATELDYNLNEIEAPQEEDLEYVDEREWDNEDIQRYRPLKLRIEAREAITWLRSGGHEELSKAYLAYGNNAELKVKYLKVALIVKVPSWVERSARGTSNDPVALE